MKITLPARHMSCGRFQVSHAACHHSPLRARRSTDCRTNNEVRSGFTLIELLVVLALIGLLLSLILPAVQRAREIARKTECLSNLHQFGIAMHAYHEVHDVFPFGYSSPHTQMLPYLDQAPLYNRIEVETDIGDSGSLPLIHVFICPSAPALATNNRTNYVLSGGVGDFFDSDTGCVPLITAQGLTFLSAAVIQDGLSQTIAFGEVLPDMVFTVTETDSIDMLMSRCQSVEQIPANESGANSWDWVDTLQDFNHVMTPNTTSCQNGDRYPWGGAVTARSMHAGSINVLAADGAAKPLSDNVDLGTWRALGTRQSGDHVGLW